MASNPPDLPLNIDIWLDVLPLCDSSSKMNLGATCRQLFFLTQPLLWSKVKLVTSDPKTLSVFRKTLQVIATERNFGSLHVGEYIRNLELSGTVADSPHFVAALQSMPNLETILQRPPLSPYPIAARLIHAVGPLHTLQWTYVIWEEDLILNTVLPLFPTLREVAITPSPDTTWELQEQHQNTPIRLSHPYHFPAIESLQTDCSTLATFIKAGKASSLLWLRLEASLTIRFDWNLIHLGGRNTLANVTVIELWKFPYHGNAFFSLLAEAAPQLELLSYRPTGLAFLDVDHPHLDQFPMLTQVVLDFEPDIPQDEIVDGEPELDDEGNDPDSEKHREIECYTWAMFNRYPFWNEFIVKRVDPVRKVRYSEPWTNQQKPGGHSDGGDGEEHSNAGGANDVGSSTV